MRRVRYQVACSLDGYIAGPNGEFDWITPDPDIDFKELFSQFDTLLMGRRTYEGLPAGGGFPGMKVFVFSRTMRQAAHANVTVVSDNVEQVVNDLRAQPGKDIWLFGGGALFRSLLALGCVDSVEPAIVPILLGGGLPFLPAPSVRRRLALTGQRVYDKSGIVLLEYAVQPDVAKKKKTRAKASH
jgi:dihydrofolate reductase